MFKLFDYDWTAPDHFRLDFLLFFTLKSLKKTLFVKNTLYFLFYMHNFFSFQGEQASWNKKTYQAKEKL